MLILDLNGISALDFVARPVERELPIVFVTLHFGKFSKNREEVDS